MTSTITTPGGDPVGRVVPHTLDGTGTPAPVGQSNPMPTAPVAEAPVTVLNRASAVEPAAGNSGTLNTTNVNRIAVDVNLTALTGGTAPTVTFFLDRQGLDGTWYQVWSSGAKSAPAAVSTSVGDGCTVSEVIGAAVRLRWTFGGTVNPTSVTFSVSILGRS